MCVVCGGFIFFFFSSRRRHTSCALVTGVQTCALPIYACQMRHVANGIIDLSLVERPPSPIREACALIKADRQIGVYKIGITDLFALAQRHCRDLGVEHGMGRLAREIMDKDRKSTRLNSSH